MKDLIATRLTQDSHPALIERMRVLFNANIDSLATKPLSLQTSRSQYDWWRSLDHTKVTFHIYSPKEWPWEIVAFSMVTDRGDYCSPMFAISNLWWGRGYGEQIIQHYLLVADEKPLQGEQLASNGAICHLNEKLGWLVVREENGVQYLRHPNNRQQEIYDEIIRYQEEGPQ